MAHWTRIQAIKIQTTGLYQDHPELGVYSDTVVGSTDGTATFTPTNPSDLSKFYIGQKVQFSARWQAGTWYTVDNWVGNTGIALSGSPSAPGSGITCSCETEIRWSEVSIVGLPTYESVYVPSIWKAGIISKKGLGAINEKADLCRGGAPVAYDGMMVVVDDTNQLLLRFIELGIKLVGLECQVWEFVGDETDSSMCEVVKLATYCIEDCTWNETQLTIKLRNNIFKRRAQMGTVINNNATSGNYPLAKDDKNGKIVPITYGKFLPDAINSSENQYAKFIRTSEIETVLTNDFGNGDYCDPQGANIFPITSGLIASPYLGYIVNFGTTGYNNFGGHAAALVGKYIQVVFGGCADGTSFVGKYRKIAAAQSYGATSPSYALTLETYFEKDLSGNSDATATNNAWVKITDIPFEYSADVWPCKGFLDESGSPIVSPDYPRLAVFDSNINNAAKQNENVYDPDTGDIIGKTIPPIPINGFVSIPNYGYSILSFVNKNKLLIDLKMFEGSPDKLNTFSIYPLINLTKYLSEDLTLWGNYAYVSVGYVSPGPATNNIYSRYPNVITKNTDTGLLNPSYAADRCDTNGAEQSINASDFSGSGLFAAIAFECEIDISKILMEYSNYYLGIKSESHSGNENDGFTNSLELAIRKFMGNCEQILSIGGNYQDEGAVGGVVDNLSDWYYLTRNIPDNDKAFNVTQTVSGQMRLITGYNNFPLPGISSIDQLKSIHKIGIIFHPSNTRSQGLTANFDIKLFELALICKLTLTITSEIYAIFAGRIYNNTWGGRKTAPTDMISNPIDILEHVKRSQNWSAVGDRVLYGKQYCPGALIRTGTSTDGSFDHPSLATVKTLSPAYQITDAGNGWTDKQTDALCRRFFLISRQDEEGFECVHYLDPQLTDTSTPDTSVTFADMVGAVGDTIEPKQTDIFVEPFVNYAFNPGTNQYDRQLRVLNSSDSAWIGTGTLNKPQFPAGSGWQAVYTPGFQCADGQDVWLACKALWNRFKTLESPPQDKTDCKEIVLYVDALKIIKDWIAWMPLRRASFAVPYSLIPADGGGNEGSGVPARNWYVGKKILFKNPHKTNGWSIKVLIEAIEKNKNANTVKVNVVLLQDIPTAFFLA